MAIQIIIIILLILASLSIIFSIFQNQGANQTIIYRYIPRTFDEEMDEPVYVSDIFRSMFAQQSPWVKGVDNFDTRKSEAINKYFISQY